MTHAPSFDSSAPLEVLGAANSTLVIPLDMDPVRKATILQTLAENGARFAAVPSEYGAVLADLPPRRRQQYEVDEIAKPIFLAGQPNASGTWDQLYRASDEAVATVVSGSADRFELHDLLAMLFLRRARSLGHAVSKMDGGVLRQLIEQGSNDYPGTSALLGYARYSPPNLKKLVGFVQNRYPDMQPLPPIT